MNKSLIRVAVESDLKSLLELYTYFGNPMPQINDELLSHWRSILATQGHCIIVCTEEDKPVSTCALTVIKNLTHGQRPYALVENVVTHPDYRKRGLATAVLGRAREIAESEGCYKIMLLTGSREEATLGFYRRAGYNSEDKTAFIMWLD